MSGLAVTIRIDHQPGAAAIDAAIPAIAGEFLSQAANGIDTALQALGVQGVTIGVELGIYGENESDGGGANVGAGRPS